MTTADQKRYGIQPTEEEKKREREKRRNATMEFFPLEKCVLIACTHTPNEAAKRTLRTRKKIEHFI